MSLTTDCCLRFSPGQTALACLALAGAGERLEGPKAYEPLPCAEAGIDVASFVSDVTLSAGEAGTAAAQAAVAGARALLVAAVAEGVAFESLIGTVKPLDKRLTRCLDPAYLPGTAEYEARMVSALLFPAKACVWRADAGCTAAQEAKAAGGAQGEAPGGEEAGEGGRGGSRCGGAGHAARRRRVGGRCAVACRAWSVEWALMGFATER